MYFLSKPVFITVEINPICNNNCIGCGNVFSQNKPPISFAQWEQVFTSLKKPVNVRISGGEPTLSSHFYEIIELLKKLQISFVLFSNGRWENPKNLINELVHNDCCQGLLISLHGHNADIHESFSRVNGSFEETVKNIQLAINAGLTTGISTIITRDNFSFIDEVVSFAFSMGIDHINFARHLPTRGYESVPNNTQLKTAMEKVEKHYKNGKSVAFSVCIPQCFSPSSSEGCLSGIAYCVIDPWGNVRPCPHTSIICGNLLENSMEEIWDGSSMKHWREMMPQQCNSCVELDKCHGGCKAAAFLNNSTKDPLLGKPITKNDISSKPLEIIKIFKELKPESLFEIIHENFGLVLLKQNEIIPVSYEAEAVLNDLSGEFTVEQLNALHGKKGIDLIGFLYYRGFVEFV